MSGQGYACLADAVSPAAIAEARAWVMRELERHSGEYFSYIGREARERLPDGGSRPLAWPAPAPCDAL
jgi:hypothetical protein